MCVSVQFNREDGSGSGLGSWKTDPAVPVPRSVPGKTVPTVPVSGSGSVPGPPCLKSLGSHGLLSYCTLIGEAGENQEHSWAFAKTHEERPSGRIR